MPTPSRPRLRVTGRAIADYLEIAPMTMQNGADAGLFAIGDDGAYDAEEILRLGRRPFVEPSGLDAFEPRSILLVQQTSMHLTSPDDPDNDWRGAWGWSVSMAPQEAVDAARGWWPVAPERRHGVVGIVSVVASFVVTIATVDRARPVERERNGRVVFRASPANHSSAMGRELLAVFEHRRFASRRGSSFLLPA